MSRATRSLRRNAPRLQPLAGRGSARPGRRRGAGREQLGGQAAGGGDAAGGGAVEPHAEPVAGGQAGDDLQAEPVAGGEQAAALSSSSASRWTRSAPAAPATSTAPVVSRSTLRPWPGGAPRPACSKPSASATAARSSRSRGPGGPSAPPG